MNGDIEIVVFNDKSWVRISEYEKLEKEDNELMHFLQEQILKLEEENEQLKNCLNCKFGDLGEDNIWCYNKERYGSYDAKKGCKHWELAEV